MTADPIPVCSARALRPFTSFMCEIGAPVDRWLEKCQVPLRFHEDPDTLIPTLKYWEFIGMAARPEGVDYFGIRIAHKWGFDAMGARTVVAACSAPTLLTGIEEYARIVLHAASAMRVWISAGNDGAARINLGKPFGVDVLGFGQTEWVGLTALIKVVQLFAGRMWQPDVVSRRSSKVVPPLARELFPDVQFLCSQPQSFISFPKELLSLPPCAYSDEVLSTIQSESADFTPAALAADFPGSLKQILKGYLRDGYPSVAMAAELAGMSTRTLQRRLAERGLSYSTLVDRARFEVATRLLTRTDATSLTITFETGYQNPSHFARAFRRSAGCSPREYRFQQLI